MTIKTNTFEGGTTGTAITTANSGGTSGTAFDAAANVNFTNARAAHGTLSAESTAAATGTSTLRWALASETKGTLVADLYLGAQATVDLDLLRFAATGDVTAVTARINAAGKLRLTLPGSVFPWTATNVFPINQWVRVELYAEAGTGTSGKARLAYYLGDSTTAVEDSGLITGLDTAAAVSGGSYVNARVGKLSTGSFSATVGVDNLGVYTGTDAVFPVGPAVLASETWTGADGAAWPAQWTISGVTGVGVADINANRGRMFTAATSYGQGPRAYLSGMPSAADVDLVVSFTTASTVANEAGYFHVGARSDGTFTGHFPNTGYFVEFCTSSDGVNLGYFQLFKGAGTNLTAPSMFAFAASTTYRLRLRVVGNLIQAKWWLASGSEPGTWGLTVTDTSFPSAGKVALTSLAGNQTITRGVFWDDLTVNTVDVTASVSWQSEVSPTALQLGWILTSGTSVRAVAATDAAYTTKLYGNTITRPASGWCTSRVTGLTANTLYFTGVEVDGTIIATGRGQYRTLRTDLAAAKVITSSCYAVPGDQPVLARIKTEAPAFFVQQGDIHYWDAVTDAEWRTGFSDAVTSVGLASTLATVPMPYFWNNHDAPVAGFSPAAVRELSAGTVYPDSVGLWRTWVHAGVRYINIDPYAHRSPYTDPDTSAKTMLGATQKAWLLNLLATASEQAIIVFSGFAHPSIPAGTGRWANYPDERTEIGNAIAAIPTGQRSKIVFVGGDTHTICADDGTNAMWGRPSLNASPMQGTGNGPVAGTWNITNQAADSARGYFSRLNFTVSGSTLNMTWDAVRDDGVVMATWSKSFPATTTTPPTANAGADQTNVEPWSTVTLTGTDSDSDGTIASRAWTQTAGSPTVTLSGTGATRTFEAPGTIAGTTLTFQYAATDDGGATTTDTMTVAILPVTERAVIGGVEVPMQIRTY